MNYLMRWALIYTGGVALMSLAMAGAGNAETPEQLVGRWTAGRISTIQYRDTYTGAPAPTNGNAFGYEFRPDGTYSFTGLMQSVMYNCTTTMFSNETGTYTVDGSSVSLRPEKNPYRMTNTCAPSSNREAPGKLIPRTYQFRISQDSSTTKLDLIDDSGAARSFTAGR
ncbi:MAG TPA: hypothetical protein VEQ63_14955 [Bryobacteraceae bacterium]|nr:hypothetical protein [Bryobacteraceae bacterium]